MKTGTTVYVVYPAGSGVFVKVQTIDQMWMLNGDTKDVHRQNAWTFKETGNTQLWFANDFYEEDEILEQIKLICLGG